MLRRVLGVDVGLRVAARRGSTRRREREVFRIAQEALQNAVRHSHAERVEVRLDGRQRPRGSRWPTTASGSRPPTPSSAARRLGLTSMEERARAVGGELTIESEPGAGTTVRLEVGG